MKKLQRALALALVLVGLLASCTAHAATCTWVGATNWADWANKANWQGGNVPSFLDTAEFKSNAKVKLTGDTAINAISIGQGVELEMISAFNSALSIVSNNLSMEPGVQHVKFTHDALDASRAKSLTLTGDIRVLDRQNNGNPEHGHRSGCCVMAGTMRVTIPTGRATIGENSKLFAGDTSLATGKDSWLKPEGDILFGAFKVHEGQDLNHKGHDDTGTTLIMTNDVAAHGKITLKGTLTFNGDEGGFLAYPDSSFALYAGGAIMAISGGQVGGFQDDRLGRADSIDDPLNGIELNYASLTSGRSGLLLNGYARAYGIIRMRGNLIFAPNSSLVNYDTDGFTIIADGRPVMICIDGPEIGTGIHESFLIMRGDSNVYVNASVARSAGIMNRGNNLSINGANFTIKDDMPCSGTVMLDGSFNFTDGGLIVYPEMTFTLKAPDGSTLSLSGGNEHDNYDNPLNGFKLDGCKFLCNNDGFRITGKAQGFGQFEMNGNLILASDSNLGNYDHGGFTVIAGANGLKIRADASGSDPWADLLGERDDRVLKAGDRVEFDGSVVRNANRIENWNGQLERVGRVRGL